MDDIWGTLSFYSTSNVLRFALILTLSFLFSGVVRRLSMARGFVCYPSTERWSKREVALGGGIAIQSAILLGLLTLSPDLIFDFFPPLALMLAVGVIDDIRGLSPKAKLAFEFVAAIWIAGRGYVLPLPNAISFLFTVIWIVGLMNAVNMIDNMDGLSSGIGSLVALGIFAILSTQGGGTGVEKLALMVAAACAGFLIRNFPPASIFMGDGGSLPLGFLIGALSTEIGADREFASFDMITAMLAVAYPLFDGTFVTCLRTYEGRPVYVGGKDHSSHRLVKLGLSDQTSVIALYGFQIAAIGFAFLLATLPSSARLGVALCLALAMVAVGYLLYIQTCPRVVHET